jgi:transcriptional regulator with XRE-family HTH domain
MSANTLEDAAAPSPSAASPFAASLGGFLRDRRSRLQPGPDAQSRRRTPGLRREEVAARAGVSVTWYTWLEQGRGGPPSNEVLERLARALELDAAGREVLFLLAQQRPPPLHPAPPSPVEPALQRVLDAMPASPAVVKTPCWDIVAWNRAAAAVLTDYGTLPVNERNVLRMLFSANHVRRSLPDWEADVRFALAAFRIDVARAGGSAEATALAAELQASSPDFRRLCAVGPLTLEYSAFAVDGAAGLSMVVYTPISAADVRAVETLIARKARPVAVAGWRNRRQEVNAP